MTSREAFEAHIQAKTGEKPQMIGGFDTNLRWREDWEIWQAAYEAGRTAEREECAQVCEAMKTRGFSEFDDVERGYNGALRRAADAIRARGKP